METLTFDLDKQPLREVNQFLHGDAGTLNGNSRPMSRSPSRATPVTTRQA